MDFTKRDILVLSGGGVKGFYFPGVILVLKIFEFNPSVIAGTSIGGFIAAMYCLGFEPLEMIDLFMATDFHEMLSEMKISNFLNHGWFCNGEWFDSYISDCIRRKTGKNDITLDELYKLSKKKLIVNTVVISKNTSSHRARHILIDHESHPDMSLIQAIRMTICIPGFIKPVLYDGEEAYDGGTIDNYLLHLFPPERSLGLYLGCRRPDETGTDEAKLRFQRSRILENIPMVEGIKTFVDIIWELFNFLTNELEKLRTGGKNYLEICIPTRGVKTLSLNIQDSKKQQMILDGIREGLNFIMSQYRKQLPRT